jgi:sugar phosphate isomerase/epimerase
MPLNVRDESAVLPALLHSVSYSGSWGQACLTLDDFVDRAANLGYEGVMLMAKRPHLSPLDYPVRRRDELRAHIEKAGLTHVCVAAYNNFTGDWEHGDVPQLEIQIQYLTELARLTADIGGKCLRIFTGYERPGIGFAAQWRRVVNGIRECSRRAAEFGVTIAVQNHHDIGTPVESQRLLLQAVGEPNCKAAFDAWAPALHGADLEASARKMAAIAAHTTAANYQAVPRCQYQQGLSNYAALQPWMQAVPIDEGFIDYEAFLGALCEGGFCGTVAYEMCSALRDGGSLEVLDSYARRFIEFLAEVREQAHVAVLGGD